MNKLSSDNDRFELPIEEVKLTDANVTEKSADFDGSNQQYVDSEIDKSFDAVAADADSIDLSADLNDSEVEVLGVDAPIFAEASIGTILGEAQDIILIDVEDNMQDQFGNFYAEKSSDFDLNENLGFDNQTPDLGYEA